MVWACNSTSALDLPRQALSVSDVCVCRKEMMRNGQKMMRSEQRAALLILIARQDSLALLFFTE